MSTQSQHQFSVDSEGRLHETAVSSLRDSMAEAVPDADPTALEAEFMLLRATRLISSIRDAHWANHGLTYSRVLLLRLLYTSPEQRLSMGDLATRMNLGSNSVTQLVDSLTRRDLVGRAPAERDKRVILVALTTEGRRLTKELLPENVKRISDTWSPLTKKERQAISHLLAKVRLHLLTSGSVVADSQLLKDDTIA